MQFSPLLLTRQKLPSYRIDDIPGTVRRELAKSGFAQRVAPGAPVAIGVGSRGIANIDIIVHSVVAWWKEQGAKPFLFPAMGSHGAATAHGQTAVLAKYGITEAAMGCPIRSSLQVVDLGATPEGIEVVMDKTAYDSGAVMMCSRVKWHTDFEGNLESGLFKMMAIGLGKFAGAQRYHTHGYRLGLEAVIRGVGRQVIASGKILGGLAIMEDGNHQTGHLEAVPAAIMERREEELLVQVKGWMPRIPLKSLDLLIVNQLGKNISGAGMDPKVINRTVYGDYNPWPYAPRVGRVFLREMHPLSYGNAVGLGMADIVNSRVVKQMKKKPTYVNGLTSGAMASIRIPVHFPTDRECVEQIWRTVGVMDPLKLQIGWIRNSQDLTLMAFSESLRPELETNPMVEILGRAKELEYDDQGNLVNWLA
ncbi:hypothetical protein [uncultured Paludibaculum sp.]|uniref:hypothetical protein n=1 Tax=uncultured Paludibaculum sp. TaxID=1765020 RepID=UPI002AABC185|nr:hypothetical protein [uncultured Paludibaculum sp.]